MPRSIVERFRREWAAALTEAEALASAEGVAGERLSELSGLLARVLVEPTPRRRSAVDLGAALSGPPFRGAQALAVTLRLIRTRSVALFEIAGADAGQRLDEVLDEVATGFAEALRDGARVEQERLLDCLLQTRHDAEQELRASEERFRTIFTEAGVGIGMADLTGVPLAANPALMRMCGTDEVVSSGRPIQDLLHPHDAEAFAEQYRELAEGRHESVSGEVRMLRADDSVLWVHHTHSLVRGEDGAPAYIIGVLQDVTERYQLRSRLHHQAHHDRYTRLPNRVMLEERLQTVFAAGSGVHRVGLCHLDLDHFRGINDSLGSQIGDQLLLAVAGRLQLLAGEHLVTRTGGDQFVILVCNPNGVEDLSNLAERLLVGMRAPFVAGRQRLSVTASIGVVERPVIDTWPTELLRGARAACSWAKAEGGARCTVFDTDRDAGESMRFALAAGVPSAVDRDEFQLYYQPLVDLPTGELAGVEALVRWWHPEHGLLGPARFIDLAERNGAIVPLGRWVLAQACQQAKSWADRFGVAAPYVSVNVAPRQLIEPGWLGEVSDVLADSGLEPHQLQLEITERAVLVDQAGAASTLRTLRDMGVRLTIDDFGTGYSSLSYLRQLPVHGLKIDGSFIRGLSESGAGDTPDGKIVASLISMAHALDLSVTAEWVETAAQARRLTSLGCDVGQGNWFGYPLPANRVEARLAEPLAG